MYKQFCKETYVPVFSQTWWLDAAAGPDNWDVYVVCDSKQPVAAMPYYFENRPEGLVITKAKNTQNNGIIFKHTSEKLYTKICFEERVINEICDYIESLNLAKYEQQYHYGFTNCMPFLWRGYEQMTRYTYVIHDTSDYNSIFQQYAPSVRTAIRKAGKIVTLTEDISREKFYEVCEKTYARQGMKTPYSYEYICRVMDACDKHHYGKYLAAIDSDSSVHSVALIIWDEQSIYYLINGTDPVYKNSGANTLLIDHCIQTACIMGKKFDFEGSVIKPIEFAYRKYGGEPIRYFRIIKTFK